MDFSLANMERLIMCLGRSFGRLKGGGFENDLMEPMSHFRLFSLKDEQEHRTHNRPATIF